MKKQPKYRDRGLALHCLILRSIRGSVLLILSVCFLSNDKLSQLISQKYFRGDSE